MGRLQFSLRTLLLLPILVGIGIVSYPWWSTYLKVLAANARSRPIDWQPHSTHAMSSAKQSGRPILLCLDANWDISAHINKKTFETPKIRRLLSDYSFIAIHGDYSERNNEITAEMKNLNVEYVPVIAIYSPGSIQNPTVLNGLTDKAQIETTLRKATAQQVPNPPWRVFKIPLAGALGLVLMLGLAHGLALSHQRQHNHAAEASSSPVSPGSSASN